jgi:hypothetical protein
MNPPAVSPDTPPAIGKGGALAAVLAIAGAAVAVLLFWVAAGVVRQRHLGIGWLWAAAAVFGVGILVIAYAASRAGQRLARATQTAAARRYHRRFFIAMGAYVLTILSSAMVFASAHPAPWLAALLALAPAIPIIAVIAVMGLYLREETDELERAISAESGLWATGALLAIATTWGFLEQFGLVIHIEAWAVFPIWAASLGVATGFVRRRYR